MARRATGRAKATRQLQPADTRQRLGARDKDVVVTTVALPRDLHLDLTMAAKELRWTFTVLAKQALSEWLDRYQSPAGRALRGAR